MQSDFRANSIIKAKEKLAKNLDISQKRQRELDPTIALKRSWWYKFKVKISHHINKFQNTLAR